MRTGIIAAVLFVLAHFAMLIGVTTPEKFYFDIESGLLLRNDWEAKTPGGPLPRSYYLEDYREVDGIKFPHTFRQPETDIPGWTFKITEIKHNVSVDDAKFKKPEEK